MSKISKRPIVLPTVEEDRAITQAARHDPDAQPLTSAQLKAMVPMRALRGRPKSENKKLLAAGVKSKLMRSLLLLWTLPNTLIGLALAAVPLIAGGRATWSCGALEVTYRRSAETCGKLARALPFRAIVFGHVILAVTAEELACITAHERVHVRQYERWGPFFLPAYGLASLWQWVRGRNGYWDNPFEIEARLDAGSGPA